MAPKHLKVRATLHPDMQRVTIKILEQSHFLKDFGGPTLGYMVDYNGNQLYSSLGGPADSALSFRFYVAGSPKELEKETRVSVEKWKWIKVLIQKYNEWGATQ